MRTARVVVCRRAGRSPALRAAVEAPGRPWGPPAGECRRQVDRRRLHLAAVVSARRRGPRRSAAPGATAGAVSGIGFRASIISCVTGSRSRASVTVRSAVAARATFSASPASIGCSGSRALVIAFATSDWIALVNPPTRAPLMAGGEKGKGATVTHARGWVSFPPPPWTGRCPSARAFRTQGTSPIRRCSAVAVTLAEWPA